MWARRGVLLMTASGVLLCAGPVSSAWAVDCVATPDDLACTASPSPSPSPTALAPAPVNVVALDGPPAYALGFLVLSAGFCVVGTMTLVVRSRSGD
jgi:hypothetical protein